LLNEPFHLRSYASIISLGQRGSRVAISIVPEASQQSLGP